MIRRNRWSCGKEGEVLYACQVATPETTREPLQMSPLPDGPWKEVSVDFKQLSGGGYLLVVYDDY